VLKLAAMDAAQPRCLVPFREQPGTPRAPPPLSDSSRPRNRPKRP
jgi:hypothetical protein